MKNLKLSITAILILLLAAVSACAASPVEVQTGSAQVRIIVTQNFGKELVLDQKVDIKEKSNALDALKQVAQVDTSYGGGFINSINGVRSKYGGPGSSRQDWFFYINGIQSNTGALDYTLHTGDTEQWDFHSWSLHQSIPAITGNYPGPFARGYAGKTRPTVIAFTSGLKDIAAGLKQSFNLSGVSSVNTKDIVDLSNEEKESANLVLLAAGDNALIDEINRNWKRLGFFAYFDQQNLVALNSEGHVQTRYGAGTGLIQAVQNPWNPNGTGAAENVVWLVSGIDREGVKAAADILNHADELKCTFAVVVSAGKIVKLPQ